MRAVPVTAPETIAVVVNDPFYGALWALLERAILAEIALWEETE